MSTIRKGLLLFLAIAIGRNFDLRIVRRHFKCAVIHHDPSVSGFIMTFTHDCRAELRLLLGFDGFYFYLKSSFIFLLQSSRIVSAGEYAEAHYVNRTNMRSLIHGGGNQFRARGTMTNIRRFKSYFFARHLISSKMERAFQCGRPRGNATGDHIFRTNFHCWFAIDVFFVLNSARFGTHVREDRAETVRAFYFFQTDRRRTFTFNIGAIANRMMRARCGILEQGSS